MTSSTTSRGIEPTVNSSVFAAFRAGITTIVLPRVGTLSSLRSASGTVSGTAGLHVDGASASQPRFGEGAAGGKRESQCSSRQREGTLRRREPRGPGLGPANRVVEVGVGGKAAHDA